MATHIRFIRSNSAIESRRITNGKRRIRVGCGAFLYQPPLGIFPLPSVVSLALIGSGLSVMMILPGLAGCGDGIRLMYATISFVFSIGFVS